MRKFAYACLLICCFCHLSFAQLANTTSLIGTITDSAGAAMAGVAITAVNADTSDTYRTVTNEEGNYTIEFLKIGRYSVTATQAGFQTITKTDIIVDYNQTVRSDFTMAIGQVSERVVVTASTP
ncbi:MAG: carboxypeptidase regulatory-like domain-containing protein, partial [Acidobacteriaceae bacterium]|nr:carboxypeptidase regulatory-like domain-containing protein [Acidobacteriaceae bacterium]